MPEQEISGKPCFVVFVGLIDSRVWIAAGEYPSDKALEDLPLSTMKWNGQTSAEADEQDMIHEGLANVLDELGMDYENCTLVVASRVQRDPNAVSSRRLPPAVIFQFIRDNVTKKAAATGGSIDIEDPPVALLNTAQMPVPALFGDGTLRLNEEAKTKLVSAFDGFWDECLLSSQAATAAEATGPNHSVAQPGKPRTELGSPSKPCGGKSSGPDGLVKG